MPVRLPFQVIHELSALYDFMKIDRASASREDELRDKIWNSFGLASWVDSRGITFGKFEVFQQHMAFPVDTHDLVKALNEAAKR